MLEAAPLHPALQQLKILQTLPSVLDWGKYQLWSRIIASVGPMVFLPFDMTGGLERRDMVFPIHTEGSTGSASNELCEFRQAFNLSGPWYLICERRNMGMSRPVGFLDLGLSPFPRSSCVGWGKGWGPGRQEAREERMERRERLHHEAPVSPEAGLVKN